MKKNPLNIIEKIMIVFNGIIIAAIIDLEENITLGIILAIGLSLILLSMYNLIKKLECNLKELSYIKRYGLYSIIFYFIGTLCTLFYVIKSSLTNKITYIIIIIIILTMGLHNVSIYLLNKHYKTNNKNNEQ